ncbi:TnpV protein [Congzhengia minquanensis]
MNGQAESMFSRLVNEMAKWQGVTERLKSMNTMA